MHVVLVGSRTGIGGTERHLASLVRELPRRGFEVELITSEEGPLTDLARSHGVRSTVIPRDGRVRYFVRLLRHLRAVRPRVVHAHSGRLPCLAARLSHVPWILDTRHGLDPRLDPGRDRAPAGGSHPPQGSRSPWSDWRWQLEGLKGRLAHLTLTVCRVDADALVRRGRLSAGRVRTVYNGVPLGRPEGPETTATPADPERPNRSDVGSPGEGSDPRRDEACLGWVGRMAAVKAPERVLDLFAHLLEGPGIPPGMRDRLRLQMVGDGPLRAEIEHRAESLGITDRVEFLGYLPDPRGVMKRWRVLLLPSRVEGLPYVLLESLAMGTPVVATPVGGIAEILTGELAAGLVPWSTAEWGRVVGSLLGDEGEWMRLHTAALGRIEVFSEDAMVESIAAIYREGAGDC